MSKNIKVVGDVEMDTAAKELEKAMCPVEVSEMTRDELEESILVELQELKVEMRKLIDQKNSGKG